MINENLLKNEELSALKLRDLYSSFGYTQYKMNKFEEYDFYVRNKDFLISDRIITFTDTNGKLLALKPDVTLSIIKSLSKDLTAVQKMYYSENVYRVSGVNGRFKEIMQTGLECVGNVSKYDRAEVLYLAAKSLELLDDDNCIELSHALFIETVLADNNISSKLLPETITYIAEKNSAMLSNLLNKGLIDDKQFELCMLLIKTYSNINDLENDFSSFLLSDLSKKYFNELTECINTVMLNCNNKMIINFSAFNQGGYYSGIVFKGYINSIPNAVLSGGQYDKLIEKFGENFGAIGFAVYLDDLERFKTKAEEYDVDTIIITKENTSFNDISSKIKLLQSEGKKFIVLSYVPNDIKYKNIIFA